LNNLKNFIKETGAGITKNPADEENQKDKALLMNVMKVISDVKDVEPKTEGIIRRIKEMVSVLKVQGFLTQDKGESEPL
jgi:dynein heavy chain